MTVKYEVREVAGSGFSMGSGRIGDTIQYAVFNGERKVWSSSTYFADSLQGRARNAIKAQATKSRNSYQSYYDRTGKCWEIEQDAKEGEKLFGDEVKALIDLTERKFASTPSRCCVRAAPARPHAGCCTRRRASTSSSASSAGAPMATCRATARSPRTAPAATSTS